MAHPRPTKTPHPWVQRGATLVVLCAALVPLAWWQGLDLQTSVGADDGTGQVFVPRHSEAARRGFALPGEGRPARTVERQAERSTRILVAAGVEASCGLLFMVGGSTVTVRRRLRWSFGGRDPFLPALLAELLPPLGGACGGALIAALCAAPAWLVLSPPLKLVGDGIFSALLLVLVAASFVAAFLRSRGQESNGP